LEILSTGETPALDDELLRLVPDFTLGLCTAMLNERVKGVCFKPLDEFDYNLPLINRYDAYYAYYDS
jgi:hypothetical protein